MTENGLYVLSPNPVYDVVGEGASFTRLFLDCAFWPVSLTLCPTAFYLFSAFMLLVGWQEGYPSLKTLHQNQLAMVVDISVCSTSWQPHLPVSATEGATGLPMYT